MSLEGVFRERFHGSPRLGKDTRRMTKERVYGWPERRGRLSLSYRLITQTRFCSSTLAIGRHFQRPEHCGAEISARLCPWGLWDYRIRAGSSAPIAIRRLESSGSASHHDLRVFSGRRGPGRRWAGATPQEMAAVSGTVSHAEGRNGQSRGGDVGRNRVQPVWLRGGNRRKSKSCRGQPGLLRSLPGGAGHPDREYWPRRLNERPTGPILSVASIPKGSDRSQPREPSSTYPPGPRLSTRYGPTPQPTPPTSGPHHRHLPARPRRQFLPRPRDGPAGPAAFPGTVARPVVPAGSPPPPGLGTLAAR